MTIKLITTGVWGLLLGASINVNAELIDQQSYLNATEYQTERKLHVWPDGARYEGEWLKNQPHGYGSLTYANGSQYWGRFDHGRRQGQGMMKYSNGDEFEGTWQKDQPNGSGTKRYAAGSIYKGEFKDGQQHGEGRQTYVDGTYYQGSWYNDQPHGFGKLTFISGGVYEGSFEHGKPHGQGRYNYPSGDVYSGEWRNGNQDGAGRIDYSTGGFYEGEFVEGMKHGKGTLMTALGREYNGPFRYNEAHGMGTCTRAGKSTACEYKRDKQVKPKTVIASAPAPEAKPAPKPAPKPKPAPIAKTAAITVSATTVASNATTSTATKPAPKPKTTLANVKPEQPTPQAKTPKKAAPADSASKYTVAKMSIPGSKQHFTQTVEKEKARVKHLTIAELRSDRSDIYFTENWSKKDLMAIPEQAWWQKRASLFSDSLHIISVHGDTEIRMIISDYKGPGNYLLEKAVVYSESEKMKADKVESGTIVVESDTDGWISGSFQFQVNDGNGNKLAFDHGAFRLSDRESLPRFYR
jgi:hypothetical protein